MNISKSHIYKSEAYKGQSYMLSLICPASGLQYFEQTL